MAEIYSFVNHITRMTEVPLQKILQNRPARRQSAGGWQAEGGRIAESCEQVGG